MQQRYYSLDVFRGATVALMILVNNPGSWSHVYHALSHAEWNGFSGADAVFPFFLFAVGNALSFVMLKLQQASTTAVYIKILKRTFLIFLIGYLINWMPFVKWDNNTLVPKDLSKLRIMGVLQRIALCYGIAALLIYHIKPRVTFLLSCLILIGYWAICFLGGDQNNPYSMQGFLGTYVDKFILGENLMYKGEGSTFDPEGLLSTIPAIVQVIFGYLVGLYIQQKGKTFEMLANLLVIGCVLVGCGLIWDSAFPINKKMWTSAYVVYSTGLAVLVLSILIYAIEFKNKRGMWSKFFDVFGKNALFIFMLSGIIPRIQALIRIKDGFATDGKIHYTTPFGWFYKYVCAPISTIPEIGSLLYAIITLLVFWTIVYWMDKKKIYIKV